MNGWWWLGLALCFIMSTRLLILYLGATVVLSLMACSPATPLTWEQEYNRQVDLQNWVFCAAIYEAYGQPTYHDGHSHSNGKWRHYYVKDDLFTNNCRSILKRNGLWEEGI